MEILGQGDGVYYIKDDNGNSTSATIVLGMTNIMQSNNYGINKYGIFVNLNTLDEEVIDKMYFILYNLIDNKESILTSFQEKEETMKEVLIDIQEKIVNPKPKRDIYLHEFSEEEQNIISKSKKYF